MARTGPRRNRITGPAVPSTPPNVSYNAYQDSLPPAKRRKINESYYQYETPQKAQVTTLVAWKDKKPFKERATKKNIFDYCKVSEH